MSNVPSKSRSFSLWSFLRDVLVQGTAIQQDWEHGNLNTYEAYAARMDQAAREREDQLEQALKIHETALSLDTMTAERDRLRAALMEARHFVKACSKTHHTYETLQVIDRALGVAP
jgi:hypothetical protein